MVKAIILIISLLCSINATASNLPTLGVVISFDCKYCKELFSRKDYLSQLCGEGSDQPKCDLKFLPFKASNDDPRGLMFYYTRKFNKQRDFADLVYSLSIGPEININHLVNVSSSYLPGVAWDGFQAGLADSLESEARLAKIIKTLSITDYPSFVWFNDGNAELVPTSIDPRLRLQESINWVRQKL